MNLRKTGRVVVAGLAIASALTFTACSSDDGDSKPAHHATTSVQQVPPPSVADVNSLVTKALDPKVPAKEKLAMVQGMDADPTLADKFAGIYAQNNMKITINEVKGTGGNTAQVTGTLTVNGKPQPADQTPPVDLVYENGQWKVSKDFACRALTLAQQTSAACPS